jgi:galactofuranosylgalactofuranosylrhamnosyl-N-acetylglucosaminyl-diphospho-decaprenol beta-1,5/1,6-galactofuranosyltransferase
VTVPVEQIDAGTKNEVGTDRATANPHREPVWELAAHVVLPASHDPDVLPLYVEYGARQPRIDDAHDRKVRGWGEYRGNEATGAQSAEHRIEDVLSRRSLRVRAGDRASFATYVNAFPVSYWRRWTTVDAVRLEVKVTGTATVMVYRSNARGAATRLRTVRTGSDGPGSVTTVSVDLDLVPFIDGGWYWFDVVGGIEDAVLESADWFVHGSRQRSTRLSIGVTTVNKVDYVDRLVRTIAAEPELRKHLDTLWIVDQGSDSVTGGATWAQSAAALGDQLQVVPQANLGGSGGFSRGMVETLRAGRSTFHMVLDDDVRIEPESILRAVRFGSFTTRATIVGAHMFDIHSPTTLHSYGEVVDPVKWTFGAVRGVHEEWDLSASGLRETPWLHRRTDVGYNGWWMCLIPTEVLHAIGLSLPIFIKWDDAEHCIRAGAAGYPTVSLPGVAVWHVSWNDKDDGIDWQSYFHQRNQLIAALLHSREPHGGKVLQQSFQGLLKNAYSMRYYTNAIRLLALEDLFGGPERLHETLGTTLPMLRSMVADHPSAQVKANQEAFPAPLALHGGAVPQLPPRSKLVPWTLRTGLRHLRKASEDSRQAPEVAVPARNAIWWFLSQYDSALVSRADGSGAVLLQREPELFRAQMGQALRVHLRLYREWDALADRYRRSLAAITSVEAWADAFGIED